MARTKNPKPKRIRIDEPAQEAPPPPPESRIVDVAVGPNRTIQLELPQPKPRRKRKRLIIEEEEEINIELEPELPDEVTVEEELDGFTTVRIATRSAENLQVWHLLRKIELPETYKIEIDRDDIQSYSLVTTEGASALLEIVALAGVDMSAIADETVVVQIDMKNETPSFICIYLTKKALALCSPDLLPMGLQRRAKKYRPSRVVRSVLAVLFPDTIVAGATSGKKIATDITAKMVYDVVDNVQLKEYERAGGYDQKPMHIEGLVPNLRPYQEAAVQWMLQRERGECDAREWELAWVVIKDERVVPLTTDFDIVKGIFYCPFSGWLVSSYQQARNVTLRTADPVIRGGLLADSMGLGKTVEVISCILANQSEWKETTASFPAHKPTNEITVVSGPSTPTKPSRRNVERLMKRNHHGICICGSTTTFRGCLTYVLCSTCREPMHGLCAGFETIEELVGETILEETIVSGGNAVRLCAAQRCPSCDSRAANPVESRATLIITPPAILNQWEREIRRHTSVPKAETRVSAVVTPDGSRKRDTHRSLKVVVYPGMRSLFQDRKSTSQSGQPQCHLIHPHILADADIVLMTFDALIGDLGHSDENPFVDNGEIRLRGRKRYRIVPSPLTSIRWWRICLDEAQRVETPTTISARMALKLEARHRWCVSGTPVQRGKLEDLYGLLLFLRMTPFSAKDWFQTCLQRDTSVMERVRSLLCNIMWRSTKASHTVREQMGVPAQEEKKVVLRLSSVEKHFYDLQLEQTMLAVTEYNESKSKKRRGKAKIEQLSHQLHRLRAACCHPQVGSAGIGKTSKRNRVTDSKNSVSVGTGVLTMDQILDRLIDDAKLKCEESQRLAVMHTNAMASLSRLKVEAKQHGASFEESDKALLQRSCELYKESLAIARTNSKPSATIGEAVLTGCLGFLSSRKVVRDGKSALQWSIRADGDNISSQSAIRELWARFDFEGPSKRICEIQVKPIVDVPAEHRDSTQCWTVLRPKDCVFQVGHAALGGEFVDVVSFSIDKASVGDTLTFGGFRTNRSKAWRIVVKNYHNFELAADNQMNKYFVGLQTDLFEPDIASDSLQRLHVLHNYALSMTSLRQVQLSENIESGATLEKTVESMEDECENIESLYLGGARAIHSGIKRDLERNRVVRKQEEGSLAAASAKGKNPRPASDMWQDCWWDDMLANLYLNGQPTEREQLCDRVRADMESFEQSQRGQGYKANQPGNVLPPFNDVDGLRTALSLRLAGYVEKIGEAAHGKCMKKFAALPSHPSQAEQAMNSQCGRCKADWNQTGPECSHCKLETQLLQVECDEMLLCVLGSLLKCLKDTKPTGRMGKARLKGNLDERAEKFFACTKACEKEWKSAKKAWRIHSDLLNDIDEVNQCKRSMRLAGQEEDLTALTEDELNAIVVSVDIPVRMMDHGAKQAMTLGTLRRNTEILRFLKNQNTERQGESSTAQQAYQTEKCMICLSTMEGERAVLSCGHSFHDACLQPWITRQRSQSSFPCPVRCTTRTKKEDVMIASDRRKDDGSQRTRDIKGSWGTKVARLVCDLMDVSERGGEKSIVFSQYEDLLWVVEQALVANDVGYARAQGMKRIGETIKRFRSNECTVLLLNVKQGAEGLTLVEANHIFMIEPLLNCGLDKQAISRIHRIGQTVKTYVHRYLIEDTVEIKIDKLRVERQEDQIEDALNESRKKHEIEGGGIDGGFTQEELRDLLT